MPSQPDENELNLEIPHDAFSDDWLRKLRTWIGRQVYWKRLPSDYSEDCIQEQILQALERHNGRSSSPSRAIQLRISRNGVKLAVLTEFAHHQKSAITVDDAELRLRRAKGDDWLYRHFSRDSESNRRPSDAELDAADIRSKRLVTAAMNILRKKLTRTEWKLLRLRYMTDAPNTDRAYTLKEIAPLIGKTHGYLRKIHPKTVAKTRSLLADIIAQRPLR